MSTFCFIIVRDAQNPAQVRESLCRYCKGSYLYISFSPINFAPICYFEQLKPLDLVFEPYEINDTDRLGLLMEFDGVELNGKKPAVRLQNRLQKIQDLILLCLQNASRVELYLTSQMPCQNEYTEYCIPGERVAQILWANYQSVPQWCPFVPDIHLIISEFA